jgi:pyruvate kinase
MPSLESQDAVISAVIEDLKSQGKVSSGDPIVIVQGTNPVRGSTSMMRISYGKCLLRLLPCTIMMSMRNICF